MTYSHVIIAVILQCIVGFLTGQWWTGSALSIFCLGREITQAEYRWIEKFGEGRRANMPWWGAFDRKVWTKLDAWLDWIVPVLVTVLIAFFMN